MQTRNDARRTRNDRRFRVARFALIAVLSLAGCKMSCLGPKAEPIDSPVATALTTGAPESGTFDHSTYDALLKEHVDFERGRVDYAGLKKQKSELGAYTATLADVDLAKLSSEARMALLINAYNAFTLELILENYPGIESIRDLDSPWKQDRWKLAGDTVSLDDIEHGLLRPIFKDPRIHFAVNCASIGCPPLAEFAFTADDLEPSLERVTKATLNNERYARAEEGELVLTKIMSWYGDDFTAEGWQPRADSLPEFVGRYADGAVGTLVEEKGAKTPVRFADYDWSLNDTP